MSDLKELQEAINGLEAAQDELLEKVSDLLTIVRSQQKEIRDLKIGPEPIIGGWRDIL